MEDKDVISMLFEEVITLNPDLESFSDIPFMDNKLYKQSSFIGVCSRMLPEDISDYVNKETRIDSYDKKTKYYKFKRIDDEYSDIYSEIAEKGVEIGYFPSLATLKKIQNSL